MDDFIKDSKMVIMAKIYVLKQRSWPGSPLFE